MGRKRGDGRPDRRRWVMGVVVSTVVLSLALLAAELSLRWQRERMLGAEHMDPGMILYDQRLGWRLQAGWRGRHRHQDYQVSYQIDDDAYRFTPGAPAKPASGHWSAVLGDSFTFGLGVEDGQTFTALLQRDAGDGGYRNLGIPGFSTDQQLILLRERLPLLPAPRRVLLVVYLGNDLIDIERRFPLQADHAKPRFELLDGALKLLDAPVPRVRKPASQQARSLAVAVLGESARRLPSWLGRLELVRRTTALLPAKVPDEAFLERRFAENLVLFEALVSEMDRLTRRRGGGLELVLLPGRSPVTEPATVAAVLQDYLGRRLLSLPALAGLRIHNLTPALRRAAGDASAPLYFPNEGHLTPRGHRVVARVLRQRLANP